MILAGWEIRSSGNPNIFIEGEERRITRFSNWCKRRAPVKMNIPHKLCEICNVHNKEKGEEINEQHP